MLTHSSSNQRQRRSLGPNNAMHMDSAMTLRLHIGDQWHGASDGDRSAEMISRNEQQTKNNTRKQNYDAKIRN